MGWDGSGVQIISAKGTKAGIDDQNFYVPSSGWVVLRASSATTSRMIANGARSALENRGHLVYSQGNRYSVFQKGFTYGSSMDCSSLATYIVNTYAGGSMSEFTTTADFVKNAQATGLFMDATNYTSGMSLYPGDILITRRSDGTGHAAIVGDGTASVRVGAGSELLAGGFAGWSAEWGDYFEFGAGGEEGEFFPRLMAPIIEPADEFLPEELIEEIESGGITKEELEDVYDMYYIYEGRGGYSPFDNVPLDNRSYAWNRFSEVFNMHGDCPLPEGYPGSWATNSGPFTVDMAPELGALMCFSGPDGGYACVVEMLLSDEVILTSQYRGGQFVLEERSKRYGMWDFDEYMFTGFVHNPSAYMGAEDESALETFLRIADEQVGSGYEWTIGQTGILSPNGWSAAFIVACSKRAGSSLNIVIPNVDSVSTIGRVGVLRGMGTWHKGAIYGGGYEPSAGDIVIFRYNHSGKENIYKGDKAAIVVGSEGSGFEAIMGDDGGCVTKKDYSTGTAFIAGYFSPNWESIDGTTASKKEYRNIQGLYTNGVSKYDACARTVCYVNSDYKPSIGSSKIKLAAVNYTGLLANFYSVFGQAGISTATNSELVVDFWTNTIRSYYQIMPGDFNQVSGEVMGMMGMLSQGIISPTDVSGWYGNLTEAKDVNVTDQVKSIYQFLRGKGLNHAAAVGLLGNIDRETGGTFRTSAYNTWDVNGPSGGLFQWHDKYVNGKQTEFRFTKMVQYCEAYGGDWRNNLTGQLAYLWSELESNPNYYGLDALKSVPNTAEGARQAAQIFTEKFERPKDKQDANSKAIKAANGYYIEIGQQSLNYSSIKNAEAVDR